MIEINKEVAKQYRLKNASNNKTMNRRVNTKKTKKRISFIKQLKTVFEKKKGQILGLSSKEEDW